MYPRRSVSATEHDTSDHENGVVVGFEAEADFVPGFEDGEWRRLRMGHLF